MNPLILHVMMPAILPALFFLVASTPVEVLGCFTRGLIAFLIAFIGLLGALTAAIVALRRRSFDNRGANWWAATAVFFSLPAAALIFLA